jgi:hypothetical protein
MMFQILRAYLLVGFALPDVAHDAAAVAATVGVEDKDRKAHEPNS